MATTRPGAFPSAAWTYVETGTRRDLYSAGLSEDGAGHRFLWLVGDFGTILRRRL